MEDAKESYFSFSRTRTPCETKQKQSDYFTDKVEKESERKLMEVILRQVPQVNVIYSPKQKRP